MGLEVLFEAFMSHPSWASSRLAGVAGGVERTPQETPADLWERTGAWTSGVQVRGCDPAEVFQR